MAKPSGLRESPSVLPAFPRQELAIGLHACGFRQVPSSEDFIFLVFSFGRAELETWWVVNKKRHYLLKIRLSSIKH